MKNYRQTVIGRQFAAAIQMNRLAVASCPEELRDDRGEGSPFWHLAYHSLFYIDFYLSDDEGTFRPMDFHEDQAQYLPGNQRQPTTNMRAAGQPCGLNSTVYLRRRFAMFHTWSKAQEAWSRRRPVRSRMATSLQLLVALVVLASPARLLSAAGTPGVIAHRGVILDAPANTLPAIQRAIELGCAMAEIDVQYTADGEIVLMHNETVDQTTNGSGRVSDLNLAQIRSLDAGAYFGRQFVGTKVPLLREVLNLARGKIVLYLDMKVEDPGPTVRLVQEMKAQSMVIFRPWSHRTLAAILAMDSSLRVLLDLGDWFHIPGMLELLHRRFPTASFSSDWSNWSPDMLQEAKRLGVETFVNVLSKDDTVENLRQAVAMGFSYIQTDYQDRLLKILAERRDQYDVPRKPDR